VRAVLVLLSALLVVVSVGSCAHGMPTNLEISGADVAAARINAECPSAFSPSRQTEDCRSEMRDGINPGMIMNNRNDHDRGGLSVVNNPFELLSGDVKRCLARELVAGEQYVPWSGRALGHSLKQFQEFPADVSRAYAAIVDEVHLWHNRDGESWKVSGILEAKFKRDGAFIVLELEWTRNFFGRDGNPWSLGGVVSLQTKCVGSASGVGGAFSRFQLPIHKAGLAVVNVGLLAHESGLPTGDQALKQQNQKRRYTDNLGNVIILVIGGAAAFYALFELVAWLEYRRMSSSKLIGTVRLKDAKPDQRAHASNRQDGSDTMKARKPPNAQS